MRYQNEVSVSVCIISGDIEILETGEGGQCMKNKNVVNKRSMLPRMLPLPKIQMK